jgi:hypothetical protein
MTQQYRVIAKVALDLVLRPVSATHPAEAVGNAMSGLDLYELLHTGRIGENTSREIRVPPYVAWTEFGEEIVLFIVDPVGPDGQPDTERAVWLNQDLSPCDVTGLWDVNFNQALLTYVDTPHCPECGSVAVELSGRQILEVTERWAEGSPSADSDIAAAASEWFGPVAATCGDCGAHWTIGPSLPLRAPERVPAGLTGSEGLRCQGRSTQSLMAQTRKRLKAAGLKSACRLQSLKHLPGHEGEEWIEVKLRGTDAPGDYERRLAEVVALTPSLLEAGFCVLHDEWQGQITYAGIGYFNPERRQRAQVMVTREDDGSSLEEAMLALLDRSLNDVDGTPSREPEEAPAGNEEEGK